MDDDSTLAGWHRDPSGRHELRFWNGDRWSEHVIDDGIPGLDSPTRSGRAPVAAAPMPPPPPPDALTGSDQDADGERQADIDVVDLQTAEAADAQESEAVARAETVDLEAAASDREPALSTTRRPAEARARSTSRPERFRPVAAAPTLGVRGRITPQADPEPSVPTTTAVEAEPVRIIEAADVDLELEVVLEPTAAEPEPALAQVETVEHEPQPEPEPELEPEASVPEPAPARPAVSRREASARAVIVGPTVASPAGNSAGSNTSAIADPHTAPGTNAPHERAEAPRVAGVSPVPVKRYRPGSPPPSPFARPTALPPSTAPIGTAIPAWYRRPRAWAAIALVAALVSAGALVLANRNNGDAGPARLGGRAPGGAPRGSKVIDGDGFGIAAPIGWITTADPGRSFPQLRRTNWSTPLAALDPGTRRGLIVVSLHDLAHLPQVDPDLFWSDQVVDAGTAHTVQQDAPFGVHGFRATRATITDLSGTVMVAAAIDTGDRTYLVAFTGPDSSDANARFERLIQTFDAR